MLLPEERRSPAAGYGTPRPAPVSRRRSSSDGNSLDLIEGDLIASSIAETLSCAGFHAPRGLSVFEGAPGFETGGDPGSAKRTATNQDFDMKPAARR
jgi:hypothetical protein